MEQEAKEQLASVTFRVRWPPCRDVRIGDGNHGQAVIGVNQKGSRSDERVCTIETAQGGRLMVVTTEPGQQRKHSRVVVVSNLILQMASVSVSSFDIRRRRKELASKLVLASSDPRSCFSTSVPLNHMQAS